MLLIGKIQFDPNLKLKVLWISNPRSPIYHEKTKMKTSNFSIVATFDFEAWSEAKMHLTSSSSNFLEPIKEVVSLAKVLLAPVRSRSGRFINSSKVQ